MGIITSDYPVCLMWSDPARRSFKGPGHGVPATLVVFPVSNELAVKGTFEGFEGVRDVTDLEIAQILALPATAFGN